MIIDKFEKLSLFDDSGKASSSYSNVVSRLTSHSVSTSRIKPMHYHNHYPRSVIGSHMSKNLRLYELQALARLKEIIKATHSPYVSTLWFAGISFFK